MNRKLPRRLFIMQMLSLLGACKSQDTSTKELELVVGVISYGEEKQVIERFSHFCKYLGEKIGAIIQLEATFNENMAMERIRNRAWSLVFATPGLAAFAKVNYQYLPIFPLETDGNSRSIYVVRQDSSLQNLNDLQGKTIALGLPGSATGYYFPLYNLYGLTLAEILFAPTPQIILEWVAQKKASAGAMSLEEFNLNKIKFSGVEFRILFTDPHNVPPGALLISPNIERNRQELIRNYLQQAPPSLIQEVEYIPNGELPDYRQMISVVNQVTSIAANLRSQPARIF